MVEGEVPRPSLSESDEFSHERATRRGSSGPSENGPRKGSRGQPQPRGSRLGRPKASSEQQKAGGRARCSAKTTCTKKDPAVKALEGAAQRAAQPQQAPPRRSPSSQSLADSRCNLQGTWSTWSAVGNRTSRAGGLRSTHFLFILSVLSREPLPLRRPERQRVIERKAKGMNEP